MSLRGVRRWSQPHEAACDIGGYRRWDAGAPGMALALSDTVMPNNVSNQSTGPWLSEKR